MPDERRPAEIAPRTTKTASARSGSVTTWLLTPTEHVTPSTGWSEMDALAALEREILSKLEMLAEGRSSAYDKPNLHRAHPQSSAPPGFRDEQDGLSPMLSLKAYHEALMRKANERGSSARLMAIAQAFADYDYSIKRAPTFNSFDSELNTADRDAAILVHFEGCRPEWPAAYMGCSASHVEKLRRKSGRDAILGEHLERTEAFAA
jgi:hypothetical protein